MSSANDLITYQEFVDYHGNISGDKTRQVIEALITSCSQAIEGAVNGPLYVQRTLTEDYSGGIREDVLGGAKRMRLRHGPISSVTSITDDNSNTVAATDYTVVNGDNMGYLEHDSSWPAPSYRWTVVYVAGKVAATSSVDERVKLACRLEAMARYELRRPGILSKNVSGRAGSKSTSIARATNMAGLLSDEAYALIMPDIARWI